MERKSYETMKFKFLERKKYEKKKINWDRGCGNNDTKSYR